MCPFTVVRLAFNTMSATVSEEVGGVEFSLSVVEGTLGADYAVNVSTDNMINIDREGGAEGEWREEIWGNGEDKEARKK